MAVSSRLYHCSNGPLSDAESHRNEQPPVFAGGQHQGVPKDAAVEGRVAQERAVRRQGQRHPP